MKVDSVKPVVVGQGPNRTAWEHGLAIATHWRSSREGYKLTRTDEAVAEDYCRRVAITGSCGRKLAAPLDMPLAQFVRRYDRRNLNARFNGKKGKGDAFDRLEGIERANEILASGVVKIVCLGGEVQRCFKLGKTEPLGVSERWVDGKKVELLHFPHPSGISTWWNEEFNRFRAAKRLKEFLT